LSDGLTAHTITDLLEHARAAGRATLFDHEGAAFARAVGFRTPDHVFVRRPAEVARNHLAAFSGTQVVLKVVAPAILHKTDVGGVCTVPRDITAVVTALEDMERALGDRDVRGYTINQFVPHSEALGAQLLASVRWTDDFGPVVALGPGGIHAEWLAKHFASGQSVAVFTAAEPDRVRLARVLERKAFFSALAGAARGGYIHFELDTLVDIVTTLLTFAGGPHASGIQDFEINPIVATPEGPVALDVLVKCRVETPAPPPRPVHKLRRLLEPRSMAIMGVSDRQNPGRTILQNTLRAGFPRDRLFVIKPGTRELEGVACHPDVSSLPEPVDLLVLSVAAEQVPETVERVVAEQRAESVIVIPGGLGERTGTGGLEERMLAALRASRATAWQGPVLNGGNCLGIRSIPGRYDTTFIPPYKLPRVPNAETPVALIAQSGAFAVARRSQLLRGTPRYLITVGNQADLTVGDYLTYLKDDPAIRVFACYVEGLRPLDGRRWLEAAAEITRDGRYVVLYRAGRSPTGAEATASHTAALAGDYAITRELAESAGVVVADSLGDFDDLVRLFSYLEQRRVHGWGLGAVSNAGFECVAIADALGRFDLASFTAATQRTLEAAFRQCRIEGIVEARNPVDLTPICPDAVYEEVVRAVVEDPGVDVVVVGCVPLTPALQTLVPDDAHEEDLADEGSIVSRLARVARETPKPLVAVVDAGPLYEPMRTKLLESGVPTFATADRALRMMEVYCRRMMDTW
jgi:acyl-CoA synthetase (NDP forming)